MILKIRTIQPRSINSWLTDKHEKIVDIFVSKLDPRLSLKRYYWTNGIKKADIFAFHEKNFGPIRYYNLRGELLTEKINFGDLDSSNYFYSKETQILEKRY